MKIYVTKDKGDEQMRELVEIRASFDETDEKIAELFLKRMELCREIGEYKKMSGKKVYDRARETEKIQKLSGLAGNEFEEKCLTDLFTAIMNMSREQQYMMIAGNE